MKNTALFVTAIVVGLFMLNAAAVGGTFNYSDDFNYDDGDLPADWLFTEDDEFSVPLVDIKDNELRMRRDSTYDSGLTRRAGYVGDGSDLWADYTIDAIFDSGNGGDRPGLVGRWQGQDDLMGGYSAVIRGDEIVILEELKSQWHGVTELNSASLSRAIGEETLRMTFELSGDTLTAEVFEEDGEGGYTESLGSVTVTDSTHSTGSVALATQITSDGRETQFDEVTVTGTAIPEPSTLVLLGLAGLLLMKRRRV